MNFDKRLKAENPTGASITCFNQSEVHVPNLLPSRKTLSVLWQNIVYERYRNTQWHTHACRKINICLLIAELRRPKGHKTNPIPIPYMESKGNPRTDFLMVIMASGIARGRLR